MRRHMGTSSTTKGCSSPAHYFNTVSSPDVSPGGRKAALHGATFERVWHLRAKMQARTKQKHTLAHAPGTSKPPLLAPAQHTAPDNAITLHAPAGWVCFYRDKVPSTPLNDLLCVSSIAFVDDVTTVLSQAGTVRRQSAHHSASEHLTNQQRTTCYVTV